MYIFFNSEKKFCFHHSAPIPFCVFGVLSTFLGMLLQMWYLLGEPCMILMRLNFFLLTGKPYHHQI